VEEDFDGEVARLERIWTVRCCGGFWCSMLNSLAGSITGDLIKFMFDVKSASKIQYMQYVELVDDAGFR
jgi:hypothetical protein